MLREMCKYCQYCHRMSKHRMVQNSKRRYLCVAVGTESNHHNMIYQCIGLCRSMFFYVIHMGAVLNLSLFMRYFTHLALALAPSCAFQGFSAKSCPNIKLVYFAFHEAWLARVTFTIYRVFICRHLFLHFLNCCHS